MSFAASNARSSRPSLGGRLNALAQQRERGWMSRLLALLWLVVLGEVSYGLYIFQIPILNILNTAMHALDLNSGSMAASLGYVALLFAFAFTSFYFIETPLRKSITSMGQKLIMKGASL